MKNNTFLKSVLRQPLRSLVLFLLIGLAAFSFVLRTSEFVVVRSRVYEIADFYRTIGFLQVAGQSFGDVRAGADIVAASGFLRFEDRRRGFEAVLHDMQNAHIMGASGWLRDSGNRAAERFPYAFFYAVPTNIASRDGGRRIEMRLRVDDVVSAFPEHVTAGQDMILSLHLEEGQEDPLTGMEEGGRYLLRGLFYVTAARLPVAGELLDRLDMYPLDGGDMWYLRVEEGYADLTAPALSAVADLVEQSRFNHSVITLQTTKDMTAMPIMQEEADTKALMSGRFINYTDYLEANPVVVINHQFAQIRGLSVGDTITVSIPGEQNIVDLHQVFVQFYTPATGPVLDSVYLNFHVHGGDTQNFIAEEIELEIVGTYLTTIFVGGQFDTIQPTEFNVYAYIPDSIIPQNTMPANNLPPGLGADAHDFVWDVWYSFVLDDSRDADAFLMETRASLAALGLNVLLIESDADNFWASASPILQSITLNAIVFCIVLVLTFGLVTFLFIHGKRKSLAILRALGQNAKKTATQLMTSLCIIGLPALLVGSIAGWLVAASEIEGALSGIEDFAMGIEVSAAIPIYWFFIFLAAALILLLGLSISQTAQSLRRPVLELLQGKRAKR